MIEISYIGAAPNPADAATSLRRRVLRELRLVAADDGRDRSRLVRLVTEWRRAARFARAGEVL